MDDVDTVTGSSVLGLKRFRLLMIQTRHIRTTLQYIWMTKSFVMRTFLSLQSHISASYAVGKFINFEGGVVLKINRAYLYCWHLWEPAISWKLQFFITVDITTTICTNIHIYLFNRTLAPHVLLFRFDNRRVSYTRFYFEK